MVVLHLLLGNSGPSPDCSGNPLLIKNYFFLTWQSDQRKLLPGLGKKGFYNKDCNGKREKLLKKILFSKKKQ